MHCRRHACLTQVALCVATLFPTAAATQESEEPVYIDRSIEGPLGAVKFEGSDWREALAYRVGEGDTYWWTSNTEYAGDGAESRGFGQAWVWGVGRVGWEVPVPIGHTSEMEQTFVAPDDTRSRLRHETEYVHADTMVTRSYDRDEAFGEWTPRRTYTWVRRDGDPRELCPGLARADA